MDRTDKQKSQQLKNRIDSIIEVLNEPLSADGIRLAKQKLIALKIQLSTGFVMPSIGFTYTIIENNKKINGTVQSLQGNSGKFWVQWSDGETTLESEISERIA